ncbi:15791_t:CDS:2, partial [Gigaspora margarita]
MHTTFLTIFYNNNLPKVIDLMDKKLNNFAVVIVDNSIPMVIDLTKSNKEFNNLATIIVDNNNQVTLILNEKSKVQYTIFQNNDLYDKSDHTEGYFKSTKCLGYCSRKWCYKYSLLPKHEAFNKRNHEYQKLLAQIDCTIILNLKGELNSLVHSKYSQ